LPDPGTDLSVQEWLLLLGGHDIEALSVKAIADE
jgi:hypothetical protein